MVFGSPAIVSLLPTFGYVSDDKPCPCLVQAVHVEGGAGNEDDGGPLEPWHTCSHTVKTCEVAPPLCRLYKKTLPGLCTSPSFLIAGGEAGFAYSG